MSHGETAGLAGPTGPAGPAEPRDLLIVGAGGFARETAQAVAAANAVRPAWRLLGFLDDDPALKGEWIDGIEVLGGSELVYSETQAKVVVCVASPRNQYSRAGVVHRLGLPDERYGTVIHPSAEVSPNSTVGPGTVLFAQSVLTASVRVGAHVAVMPQVVLTHDVVIEDYVTIASGVRLGGGTRLERGAYLGAGCLIREFTTVGAWSLVGMGSVVLRDVPPGETWVGNPARRLRPTAVPEDIAREDTASQGTASEGTAPSASASADARPDPAAARPTTTERTEG